MALARKEVQVTDEAGNVVPGATVTVRREVAGQPLAVLYSDRDGTTPLGNPVTADSNGVAAFHVEGGAYQIVATSGAFSRTQRYVGIGTAAETDAGLVPTSVSTAWLFDSATTDVDPGSGLFRLNNAAPASATAIYLDNENAGANDVSAWLDTLDDAGDATNRGQLTICDPDQPTEVFRIYQVSGSVVDGTGYRKLTVAHVTGAGSFTVGTLYSISLAPKGAVGQVGLSGSLVADALVVGSDAASVKVLSEDVPHPPGNDYLGITRSGFYGDDNDVSNGPVGFAAVMAAGRHNNRLGLLGFATLESSRARAWIKQLGSTITAWAELLTAVGGINLTGGFSATSDDDGSKSTGTYTPVFTEGNIKRITNDGAFTLGVPTGEGTCVIQMTNGVSAGAITTSSYTKVTGDALTTTSGDDFLLFITKVNGFSHLYVQALQ